MRDEEIDDILKKLAGNAPDVEPAVLERISRSVGSDLQPVASMAASWILIGSVILIGGFSAAFGAISLGSHGIRVMTPVQISVVFTVLGVWMWVAASQCVADAIPGSRRLASTWTIALSGVLILAAVFAILFRDYHAERFLAEGVKCVTAGVGFGIPAALGTWWLLRRGFPTNILASGLTRGMLAGLAGLTMLELHCPNLEVPHLLVWHIGVLPISGFAGTLAVWIIFTSERRRSRRRT